MIGIQPRTARRLSAVLLAMDKLFEAMADHMEDNDKMNVSFTVFVDTIMETYPNSEDIKQEAVVLYTMAQQAEFLADELDSDAN